MNDWYATLDELAKFQQEQARQGIRLWYRGQSSAEWPIRSKLHRHVLEYFERTCHHFGEEGDKEFLRDEYKSLYRRFNGKLVRQ